MNYEGDLQALELKVALEFHKLICKAKKGYRLDYEFILEEISFINLMHEGKIDDRLFLTVLQFYLNNQWLIVQS